MAWSCHMSTSVRFTNKCVLKETIYVSLCASDVGHWCLAKQPCCAQSYYELITWTGFTSQQCHRPLWPYTTHMNHTRLYVTWHIAYSHDSSKLTTQKWPPITTSVFIYYLYALQLPVANIEITVTLETNTNDTSQQNCSGWGTPEWGSK